MDKSLQARNARSGGMLPAQEKDVILFPVFERPRLLFIIDAEEEFDWTAPFSRQNVNVTTMSCQAQAHRIFERYAVTPTYAIDYPVASQDRGFRPLLELLHSNACQIGAQLHTWVTPPFDEDVSDRNSFANNLPADLERRKLEQLTRTIEDNFGCAPKLYRAGRYGAGDATPQILEDLHYEIDCSVLPGTSTVSLAPTYAVATSRPYWLASGRSLLEIPVTIGDVGIAGHLGNKLYRVLTSPVGRRLRSAAIAARLGILERIRLTPEGNTLSECKRLTRSMVAQGHRIFVASYHTPSLVPGHTPYVRNPRDLDRFLHWLEGYCDFFFHEIGGVASTPSEVRQWALGCEAAADQTQLLSESD